MSFTHYLCTALVGIGLAAISSSSGAGFFDGNELLKRVEASLDRKTSATYLGGVGIGYVQGIADATEGTSIACIPSSVTAGQVEKIVQKYLAAHPELLHQRASFLVIDALSEAFPCKKKP